MTALTIILDIVLILISLVLIVAVLMQQGQRQGLGAIAGGAETFFGKGKAKGVDAKLAKITKIAATVFIILAIVTTMVVATNGSTDSHIIAENLAGEVHDDHIHLEDGTIADLDGNVITEGDAVADADAAEATAEPAAEATAEPAAETTEAPAAN